MRLASPLGMPVRNANEGGGLRGSPGISTNKPIKNYYKQDIAGGVPPLGLPDRNEMKAGGQEGAQANKLFH